jgi:hypothetical protein
MSLEIDAIRQERAVQRVSLRDQIAAYVQKGNGLEQQFSELWSYVNANEAPDGNGAFGPEDVQEVWDTMNQAITDIQAFANGLSVPPPP